MKKLSNTHYVKSVRIRSYSAPNFPAFGLNTERYYLSVFTPNTDAFYWLTEAELKRVAY